MPKQSLEIMDSRLREGLLLAMRVHLRWWVTNFPLTERNAEAEAFCIHHAPRKKNGLQTKPVTPRFYLAHARGLEPLTPAFGVLEGRANFHSVRLNELNRPVSPDDRIFNDRDLSTRTSVTGQVALNLLPFF